jgi:Icc protein
VPIHLPPISRRRFLAGSLAAAAACAAGRRGWAADLAAAAPPGTGPAGALDPSRVAFLSDIHLSADRAKVNRDVCMFEHLEKARADVLAGGAAGGGRLPGLAFVNGDLAFNAGLPGDYEVVVAALRPLREAGVPVHLNLGNHDHRANFWAAIPAEDPAAAVAAAGDAKGVPARGFDAGADRGKAVADRQVSAVDTPAVSWLLIDSLDETTKTPGLVGEAQLAWLAKALDARAGKACVVLVHHDPINPLVPKLTGIKDTAALMDTLLPRKQAKALVFGHTHRWERRQVDGLHLVNLPAVSYVFAPTQPAGWVDCTLRDGGATLNLRTIDPKHPANGEVVDLKWR